MTRRCRISCWKGNWQRHCEAFLKSSSLSLRQEWQRACISSVMYSLVLTNFLIIEEDRVDTTRFGSVAFHWTGFIDILFT